MFTAALFVKAPDWKQHRCPSTRERSNHYISIHWNNYWLIERDKLLKHGTAHLDECPENYAE